MKVRNDIDSYFSRHYRWYIAFALADIYDIYEEILLMKRAGMSQENIQELSKTIDEIFDSIRADGRLADTAYSFRNLRWSCYDDGWKKR